MSLSPSRKLNLTRDQLSAFLTDHQQIRQFELLFSNLNNLELLENTDFQSDNAAFAANEALSQIISMEQEISIQDAVLEAKINQSLSLIDSLSKIVEGLQVETSQPIDELLKTVSALSIIVEGLQVESSQPVDELLKTVSSLSTIVEGLQVEISQPVDELLKTVSALSTIVEGLQVESSQPIDGLLKTVSALSTIVDGLQIQPPGREFTVSRYGSFYDSTTQAAAIINTATAITFNSTFLSNGVYIGSPTSRVVVDTQGVYTLNFTLQIDKNLTGNANMFSWFRVNGANVASTARQARVTGLADENSISMNYILNLKANDYIELMFSVEALSIVLTATAAAAPIPALPSVIFTVANNVGGIR